MKCLILGGRGFIGLNLTERLLKDGHEVIVFSRELPTGQEKADGCVYLKGDFNQAADLKKAVTGVDVVFHFAYTTIPSTSNDDPVFDCRTNVLSTINLLQLICEAGVKRIIFISSGGTVYGFPQKLPIPEEHPNNPLCSYGVTKLMIEKYIFLFHFLKGLDYMILRVSNPYGKYHNSSKGQGIIPIFINKLIKGEEVQIWGDGSVVRDYLYIDDLIDAFILAMNHKGKDRLFNIGSGIGVSIRDLIKIIESIAGKKFRVTYHKSRPFDVPINVLDIRKAKKKLGWIPRLSIEEGIKKTFAWVKRTSKRP